MFAFWQNNFNFIKPILSLMVWGLGSKCITSKLRFQLLFRLKFEYVLDEKLYEFIALAQYFTYNWSFQSVGFHIVYSDLFN